NDMKSDTRQVKSKASNAKQIGNTTTTTSNSFDALGSMGDMDEDMGSKRVENGADQHVAKMVMSSVNEVETKEDNGKLGSLRMIWLKIQGKKNVEPKRKSCLSPGRKKDTKEEYSFLSFIFHMLFTTLKLMIPRMLWRI
ncbi:hypothetical protein Tco_1574655, partial [Tanacetum coccineum]